MEHFAVFHSTGIVPQSRPLAESRGAATALSVLDSGRDCGACRL